MTPSRLYFRPRKSLDGFLSENLPNQILYSCLKKNTDLSDKQILAAFNRAYPLCIEILDAPDIHTARSASFPKMAGGIPQESLLTYAFVYYLLSFHEQARHLSRYLANLFALLNDQCPGYFRPILISVSSLSPILSSSVSFQPKAKKFSTGSPLDDARQYVRISHLMAKAMELAKDEAIMVLTVLRATVIEEYGEWDEILSLAIEQVRQRPDAHAPRSPYRIAEHQATTFIKLMRIIYELHIFETCDGFLVSNCDEFISDLCAYLNKPLGSTVSNLLSSAKRSSNFMQVFKDLYRRANDYYTKGDALSDKTTGKHSDDYEIDFSEL